MIKDFSADQRFTGLTPLNKRVFLASPTMHGEEQYYINEAFDTNWVTTAGSNIFAIEEQLTEYIGCTHTVALASGTSALHLATKLAGEALYGQAKPDAGTLAGHKVFCSDVTFDASVNPVAYEDGEAVFIDTEYDTWNMDPEALEKAFQLYPDVKLVVIAHLYGTPGKMEEIREICDRHGAIIVEDAAESLGAKLRVRADGVYADIVKSQAGSAEATADGSGLRSKTGTAMRTGEDGYAWIETGNLGDYGAISFNGNKIITGSSGGMFLTNSKEDADHVRKWSTQSREPAPWYQHEEIGYNYRMSNIIAGVIRGQMEHLSDHIDRKREIYERYREGFKGLPVVMNPYDAEKAIPNFWLSCMLIDREYMTKQIRGEDAFSITGENITRAKSPVSYKGRDTGDYSYETVPGKTCPQEILDALNYFGAEGRPVWKPMHMQPIYKDHIFITREGEHRGGSVGTQGDAGGGTSAVGMTVASAGSATGARDVGADLYNRGVCLPSDIKMSDREQDLIIEVIRRCFG